MACKRAYAHTAQQQMGQLPVDRATPSPQFSVVGVDLAGPLLCKQFDGRKAPTVKTYACIFICLATKAVHLELLSDISTAAFLAALQRFSARRGAPSKIVSDNGKNYVGATREIQAATERLLGDRTRDELSKTHLHNLQWEFIPPGAPHFGGHWESGVRNMKAVLKRNLGEHFLTYEELTTLLTVAEAALNSRPLEHLDALPPDGGIVLTPGHFLIGRPLLCQAPSTTNHRMVVPLHRRWKFLNLLAEELWLKWKTTYLQSLQIQSCWKTATDNIRKGDLVLLKDDSLATPHWPTAVVSEVFPGEDGLVRVVDVYCKGNTYRRPTTKLSLLYSPPTPSSDDVAPSPTEKIRVMPPSIADDTSMPASLLPSNSSSALIK